MNHVVIFRVNHSRKGYKGMINFIVHVQEEYIMYFSCPWPFAYMYYNIYIIISQLYYSMSVMDS